MPLTYSQDNPDSLEILLRKAQAIKVVNNENLAFIESRKGQQVITHHRYSLQTKPSSAKRHKTYHGCDTISSSSGDEQLLTIKDSTCKKEIDDIIASWRYHGETLKKEKIAFDDFINRTLKLYDDLARLQDEYDNLLEKYTRLLTDEEESRHAVEVVLRNLEILQVAIGEIHVQTMGSADAKQMKEAMSSFMKGVSSEMKKLQSRVPGVELQYDFQGEILERKEQTEESIIEFDEWDSMKRFHVLSGYNLQICALEAYVIDEKQYLASAGFDGIIRFWDLSNNTVTATLTGHKYAVYAFALFEHNGVQMLASGSFDMTIKIWDLSNHNCVKTLSGNDGCIYALAIYKKDGQTILISGGTQSVIKLWDMSDYSEIVTLQGHKGEVKTLSVYLDDGISYLISASEDTTKIWDLDDYTLVNSLLHYQEDVESSAVVDYENTKMLICGDYCGRIKVWDLKNHSNIGTYKTQKHSIHSLQAVRYNGQICIASPGDNLSATLINPKNTDQIASLRIGSSFSKMKIFMNGERPCLACGHKNGTISLWMK